MLKIVRNHPAAALVLLFLLVFVFGVNIATFYTDWLWFGEVGYQSVFGRRLGTQLLLFLLFGVPSFALAYLNLRLAERFSPPAGIRIPGEGPGGGDVFILDRQGRPRRAPARGRVVDTLSGLRRLLAIGLLLGALAFAVFAGLTASGEWDSFLRFRNPTPFGIRDPLFGNDIGFYVFTLPFVRYVQGWLLVVLLLVGAAVALLYVFQKGIDTAAGRTFVAPHVLAHLSALLALALLTQAFGYWLDRFDLLLAGGKSFPGAGYTDIHARLPALNLLVGIVLVAALAVLVNIRQRSLVLPAGALLLWLLASFGVGVLYPGFIQATVVRPNEARREAPFIQRAITATRAAYGLHNVTVRSFPADPVLRGTHLARNQATLRNIRLWDYDPLMETYPQQQGLRQYYSFPDLDVDRYSLGGAAGYRQVWLGVREMNTEGLDARAQTWPNVHLRYTHGFGVVMSPVNEFTNEGLPTYFLKDIPTVSTVPGLKLTQPRTYYGQGTMSGSYVVVGTRQGEFDYPTERESGAADKENSYGGKGGVRLGPLAKLAFSWRFRDPTLLLSRDLTAESRLLFARHVPTRVARVAPFLHLDADPYPVIADERVLWVQDAYTTTSAYPYAALLDDLRDASGGPLGFNYIRNSVKATVDAYDGTVTLYAADEHDPILQTYRRIFPGLVHPLAQMPASLRTHLRYPEDLFSVQRRILADYHVTDPGVFYSRADSWEIPRENREVENSGPAPVEGQDVSMAPYYMIMRLPEERAEEFLLLSPFTPRDRQNMIALLAARCDGDRYGQMMLYRFPSSRIVYGPQQIGSRIRQDSQISPKLSLWNQQGSRAVFGNLLVVPVEKSLLYVQPLYLKAQTQSAAGSGQGSAIPELKQVVVAFENRIVMEGTLEEALARLFGEGASPAGATGSEARPPSRLESGAAPPGVASPATLAAQAGAQYDRAQAALRRGDFESFGREYRALGETVRRLQAPPPGSAGGAKR